MTRTFVSLDTEHGAFSRYERDHTGRPELTHRAILGDWPSVRNQIVMEDVQHFRIAPDDRFKVPPRGRGPNPTGPNAGAGTPTIPAVANAA